MISYLGVLVPKVCMSTNFLTGPEYGPSAPGNISCIGQVGVEVWVADNEWQHGRGQI